MRYARRTTTSHAISKVCNLREEKGEGKRGGASKEKEKEERGKREGREERRGGGREAVIL